MLGARSLPGMGLSHTLHQKVHHAHGSYTRSKGGTLPSGSTHLTGCFLALVMWSKYKTFVVMIYYSIHFCQITQILILLLAL